ncbi:MAG TPA: hypothetical protein DEV73_04465 [Candidatus Zambryskibacteria bacterium]|nr:hypothetical protein [Candidatus Zambryskibacteria bacterium]
MKNKLFISQHLSATRFAVISALLVGLGWFYWYQWHPSRVRSTCASKAGDAVQSTLSTIKGSNLDYQIEIGEKVRRSIYELCLNKMGVKN